MARVIDIDSSTHFWHPAQVNEPVFVWGFSAWKQPAVRTCFPNSSSVRFIKSLDDAPLDALIVLWGSADLDADVQAGKRWRVVRIEDGFLRSVGLGADLIRPISWVLDPVGMYYDARHPSRLEQILEAQSFDDALLKRAACLRAQVVRAGLTKYNVGAINWQRPNTAKRVVLVVGQVETDASLAFGAPLIKTNIGLLEAARARCGTEAYLIYKPHPDVVARLRAEGIGEQGATQYVDEVVIDADMATLLTQVDEVHVMTSLTGFEALLRGVRVVCYGQPFYSGWGLTEDLIPLERRTHALSIDELVAGVLIEYPLYFDADQQTFIEPEAAVQFLLMEKTRKGNQLAWWRYGFRWILRRVVGVR